LAGLEVSTLSSPVRTSAGSAASGGRTIFGKACGTTICGNDALAIGIRGSEVGRTWAGATELALAAARMSIAERSESSIETEIRAVNRHQTRQRALENVRQRLF
jgi:hypothetical protein